MSSYRFKCDKVRRSISVDHDNPNDAARRAVHHFGNIIARREYGRKGFMYLWNWICDGRVNAYIGIPTGNGCSGGNVIFDVDLVE